MRVVNVNADHVSGILTYPEHASSDLPGVLLLHGFAADKNEVNNTFARIADALAVQGIVSLRIDFRGDAENYIASVNDMVADAQAAHTFLSQLPEINPEKIGVIGFSLGTTVALLLSQQASCCSLTLLSPTLNLLSDFTGALGEETMEQLAQCNPFLEVDLGWKKVQLSKAFYDSLFACDPLPAAKHFSGNLLCIAGSEDFSAPNAQHIFKSSPAKKEIEIISGADHIFSNDIAHVIEKTAESTALAMQPMTKSSMHAGY